MMATARPVRPDIEILRLAAETADDVLASPAARGRFFVTVTVTVGETTTATFDEPPKRELRDLLVALRTFDMASSDIRLRPPYEIVERAGVLPDWRPDLEGAKAEGVGVVARCGGNPSRLQEGTAMEPTRSAVAGRCADARARLREHAPSPGEVHAGPDSEWHGDAGLKDAATLRPATSYFEAGGSTMRGSCVRPSMLVQSLARAATHG
jgi:hypothetical protein